MVKVFNFFLKKDRWQLFEKFLLVLIILLGLFLRIFPALNWEIQSDEAIFFFIAKNSFLNIIWVDPAHPPIFYWLLKIWSQIRIDLLFLRIPPLFFSFLNLILFYLIAKEIKFNRYFSILAVLLFSLSYLTIELSFQAKMYVFVLFLMLLSFLLYFKLLFSQEKSKISLILFCFINFLGILTDYSFAWYYLALIGGTLILLLLRKKQFSKKQLLSLKYGFGISSALMILWLPIFIKNFLRATSYFYRPESLFGELKGLFLDTWVNWSYYELKIFLISFIPLIIITCVSGFLFLRFSLIAKKLKESLFWSIVNLFFYSTVSVMIIAFFLFNHMVISVRHMWVGSLFPIFSLAGLVSFLYSKNRFYWKLLGWIVLIFVFFISYPILRGSDFYKNLYNPSYKSSYNDAAVFFNKNPYLSADTLVFMPENYRDVFIYYFLNNNLSDKRSKALNNEPKSEPYFNLFEKREKGTYLFVNFDYEYFETHFQEKRKILFKSMFGKWRSIFLQEFSFFKMFSRLTGEGD